MNVSLSVERIAKKRNQLLGCAFVLFYVSEIRPDFRCDFFHLDGVDFEFWV